MNYTYQQPNLTNGVDSVLVDISKSVNIFTPMLLFFVFCTVLIGGLISQRRREGTADFPLWSTIAGISTISAALPMTLIEGMIQINHLVIVVIVTLFSGLWLFTTRNRNEV